MLLVSVPKRKASELEIVAPEVERPGTFRMRISGNFTGVVRTESCLVFE